MRRGKLKNHKIFGEDVAVLAGDVLFLFAFEYVSIATKSVPFERIVRVIGELAECVDAEGLIGGQVADICSEENSDVGLDQLEFIHIHKTTALKDGSVVSGLFWVVQMIKKLLD
ncbi:unnamed protein product [Fraxinus pennsylvanica]|uniref:Uncharacterized protein n=1 Tax=Fraxinus pennsylvanica TaxID=56036 RepID=A0AAD1ZIJ2_9LAMI|nr:unnamed protein product [Fraxinus pennsylvanica]